jgi:hypothetical protein
MKEDSEVSIVNANGDRKRKTKFCREDQGDCCYYITKLLVETLVPSCI